MSDPSTGRIFVTGAHGFIGRHLVRLLVDDGFDVVAVARDKRERDGSLPAQIVELDLTAADEVKAAMQGCDKVVHLAARAGGIQFQQGGAAIYRENRAITDAVLDAAVSAGVGQVFVASSAVVYRPSDHPVSEDHDLLAPQHRPSPYAWSKITDEVVVRWLTDAGHLDAVVGRFANVYGPGAPYDPARSTVVHALIRRAADTPRGDVLQIWGDGTAVRSFIYVEDLARAILTVLSAGTPGTTYNIDSGLEVTIRDLARLVRDAVDPSLQLRFDPSQPAGVPYRVTSPAMLNALGFKAVVPLEEGIARTVAAFRGEVD